MRDSIEVVAKATMQNWNAFKEHFATLRPGERNGEIAYSRRLIDEQTKEFNEFLKGRACELEALHGSLKAQGK